MAFSNIATAKENKKDEFYTNLVDIKNEIEHYKEKFKNKVVLCNCDDVFNSNFVKYFLMNFNELKLKELIAIGYMISKEKQDKIALLRINNTKVYITNNKKDLDIQDIINFLQLEENPNIKYYEYLKGDFRSDFSIELLKESDIVVTNPPFSLFREYVSLLMKYNKKFLIIGNQNAITYKEIFPFIKKNKIWLGYGFKGNVGFFDSPYEDNAKSSQHKEGKIRVSGVMWFTNLDHNKRHQILPLDLQCTYYENEHLYPKYDNYDAINVNKTKEIPYDYEFPLLFDFFLSKTI